MSDHSHDELLAGGNVSKVFRSGHTVRRDLKSNSERIHALLKHLDKKGYDHAPKFLGIDENEREILSFIEGEAGHYPLKKYMWSDENLQGIAKMLRLYHDAVIDFPFDDSWRPIDHTPQHRDVLCHNDFAMYNIIFQNGRPMGIIDFDEAGPGPRIWDIAYTLYTSVPLSRFYLDETGGKMNYQSDQDAHRIKNRVALFFDSYGEDVAGNYIEMVLLRLEGLCKTITRRANEGDPAFQKMLDEGHLEHYRDDITFISEHRNEWS